MASSTVLAGRTLAPVLVTRLQEIATQHSGLVPLHGRLFAQWMHHAYPRECAYPHVAGTVKAQPMASYTKETNLSAVHNSSELLEQEVNALFVDEASLEVIGSDEVTAWIDHEE